MKRLPFLVQIGDSTALTRDKFPGEDLAMADPLAATIEIDRLGYTIARGTRLTAVKTETTDDK